MTNSNTKGDRNERELINFLDSDGWTVLRAPASGSATERELPDILAGRDGTFYAIEAKASGGDPIYLTEAEVDALISFSEDFGAEPRISAKFDLKHGDPAWGADRPGHYLFEPSELYRTDAGSYRIKKSVAQERGVPEEEL